MAGKYDSIKNLIMLNWLVSQAGDTQHFTDQSSLNLIIHNPLIKDKIDLNNDFCLQVGTLNKDYNLTDYCLIHQYDRDPFLNEIFTSKYL